jgi:hypothetical protein
VKLATVIVCVLSLVAPGFAQNSPAAQTSMSARDVDVAAARAQRKALYASSMNLTDAEGAKFWPLFDQYELAIDKIDNRHHEEIRNYLAHMDTLTEQDAASKLDEVIAIQQARLDTEKEFIPQFRAILPETKVTRFFQIESKLRAFVQYDIARMVPLAQAADQSRKP